MLQKLLKDVTKAKNPEKAKLLMRFFKTGKGEYGEGDVFYGIMVPVSRKIAQKYKTISFSDVLKLLQSKVHEIRLIALFILIFQFSKGDEKTKKEIFDFYLSYTKYINNWDLVDLSAHRIVGEYLIDKDQTILIKLAKSESIWERRIAILSTFAFIGRGESEMTFTIADILLHDKHDLIQKAVGWLLREVGKRVSQKDEEDFLKTRYKTMPRTALRYAIERFPEEKRLSYLRGEVR